MTIILAKPTSTITATIATIDINLALCAETILEVELLFRIYRFLLDAHIPFGVISISIEESGM